MDFNELVGHGTHGVGLENVVDCGGLLLPDKELRSRHIMIFSGESAGTAGPKAEYVSVAGLWAWQGKPGQESPYKAVKGNVGKVIEHAFKAVEQAITPSNIDAKMAYLDREAHNPDYIRRYRRDCGKRLKELKRMKKYFAQLTVMELDDFEYLSGIPVVIIGKGIGPDGKPHAAFPGALAFKRVAAEYAATQYQYLERISRLISGTDLKLDDIDTLEQRQDSFLQKHYNHLMRIDVGSSANR